MVVVAMWIIHDSMEDVVAGGLLLPAAVSPSARSPPAARKKTRKLPARRPPSPGKPLPTRMARAGPVTRAGARPDGALRPARTGLTAGAPFRSSRPGGGPTLLVRPATRAQQLATMGPLPGWGRCHERTLGETSGAAGCALRSKAKAAPTRMVGPA